MGYLAMYYLISNHLSNNFQIIYLLLFFLAKYSNVRDHSLMVSIFLKIVWNMFYFICILK